MSDRTRKLAVLRARTDQDLHVLVTREIERGITLTNVATTRNSPLFAQAEKAYLTATTLLSRIPGLEHCEQVRIEARLKELRLRLDQVSTFAKAERYPVLFAS